MKSCAFHRRTGTTLVELMVCSVVVATMALCAMFTFVHASRLERNLRREAYARTALAMHLERLARMLSLSNGVTGFGELTEAGGAAFCVSYPQEVGGVSFETNRIMRVRESRLQKWQDSLNVTLTNRNGNLKLVGREKRLDADFPLDATVCGSRLSVVAVSNVANGLVSVSLEAEVPLETSRSGTRTKKIGANRMIRLWNVK